MFTKDDLKFMKMAIDLAKKAKGETSPNPLVGSVIVKNGIIMGTGYHKKAGTPHAEIHAMNAAGEQTINSTLYVNLEPCSHQGRTPPCAHEIVKRKIAKVVIAMPDPNPLVNGKGIKILKDAGIEVSVGVMEEQAKKLNEFFIKYITKKIPYITLKVATSIDGKICTKTGNSKWITNEQSRQYVHKQRYFHDAIMIGIGTMIQDNPSLTSRIKNKEIFCPVRIIIDSSLKIDLDANIFKDGFRNQIIIVSTENADQKKLLLLKSMGVEVIISGKKRVDLESLLKILGEKQITSILVEGGSTLATSFFTSGLIDKILLFIAPKLIGGIEAKTIYDGEGLEFIKDSPQFKLNQIRRFKDDVLLEYLHE